MKPPIEPDLNDCCNSGCNPCIFDVYEKQLRLYKTYQDTGVNSENSDELKQNGLSQTAYTEFVVIDNVELCKWHNLLQFKLKVNGDKVFWKPGDHILVKYVCEGNSCTRAYTPIKLNAYGMEASDFSIIVKRYTNGLVSNYLCNLKKGKEALWRGPYGAYDVTPNRFTRIIMIAQGTGIAPFVNIIQKIIQNEDDMSKVILFYCCHSVDTIFFRDYFYSLKSYWNFTYVIFLSNTERNDCKYQEPLTNHKLSSADLVQLKPFTLSDQLLICGSTQFMKQYEDWLRTEENFVGNIVVF